MKREDNPYESRKNPRTGEHARNIEREELRVYAVTDRRWLGKKSLAQAVEEALRGGASLIQLREKDIEQEELVKVAVGIKKVTDAYGVKLIINDDPYAALESGAAGVHVGQDDISVGEARRILGPGGIIGASAHTVEEARRAETEGADYLGAGAVFPTDTKTDTAELSPEKLKEICGAVDIPVVAIGGVNAGNIGELKDTGVAGAAVVSAVFAAEDIASAASALRAEIDKILDLREAGGAEKHGACGDRCDEDIDGGRGAAADKGHGETPAGLKYKAAIFDYDGTIVDSMGMWRRLGGAYARKLGADLDSEEADRMLNEHIRTMSLEESAGFFRREYGAQGSDEEILSDIMDIMHDNYKYTIECKAGITDVLKDLREHGIRLCIATASPREMIESANARLGLTEYFDAVFSCTELNTSKREPEIYIRAADFLGTEPEETLVFEDVLHAVRTAERAGFPVVGIYDAEAAEDAGYIKETSDFYFNSYDEWPGIEDLRD